MRALKTMLWSVLGLALLMLLALAWLWTADLGLFKPQLENWVSEATGREFAIDGPLHIELGGTSVVVAHDIRLQNAAWADEAQMLEIGRLEVRLDLRSLFRDTLVVEFVGLDDALIRLVRPRDHEANWALPLDTSADDARQSPGLDIVVKLIDIDRVNVLFDSYKRDRVLDLRIESLDQAHRDDEFLDLDLEATLNDRRIALHGEAGTLPALLAGQDIHFDAEGQLDTFSFEASGWLDDLANLRRPRLQFSANSPNIDDLTRLLGVGEAAQGDIDFDASLLPGDDDELVLKLAGNLARVEIEVTGAFSDLGDMEQARIDVLARGPDLGKILSLAGVRGVGEAPFMIDINASRNGPELIVEQGRMLFAGAEFDLVARLPSLPSMDEASVKLTVSGPDMEHFRSITGLPGKATGEFILDFELDDDASGKERYALRASTSFGSLDASGEISEAAGFLGSTADVDLSIGSLRQFGEAYGVENLPDEVFTLKGGAELAAAGLRLREPARLALGEVLLELDGLVAIAPGAAGSQLSFDIAGPSLKELTAAFGVDAGVPIQPYRASGDLSLQSNAYRIHNAAGNLGSTAFEVPDLFLPAAGTAGASVTFSVSGPAIEELFARAEDFDVRPGPFELMGKASLEQDALVLKDVELTRDAGKVSLDLDLGLPLSRRWANFDLRADAKNMRSLFRRIRDYEAEQSPFFIDVRGELRGTQLQVEKLAVGIGDGRLSASGNLNVAEEGSSTRFSLSGDFPSLAELGSYKGRRFTDQAVRWDTRIEGRDGDLRIDDLNLTLGESDVRGSVHFVRGDTPKLELDVHSDAIVFGPLLESKAVEAAAESLSTDGRLIPDTKIPFDALAAMDASIKLRIGDFQRDNLRIGQVDLDLELQDGVLDVSNASFDGFHGWIRARGRLDPAGGAGQMSLELVARAFAAIDRGADAVISDVDINIQSSGTDIRGLAGNATGMVLVDGRGGRIPNTQALQAIYGDMLTEIINVINPFYTADPYTNIECIVIAAEIQNGRLAGTPGSFLATDKIRVSVNPSVDLKTEKIAIDVKMRPKKGLNISTGEILNPYVKVVGTLARPRLAVDEAGVLISGGAAAATGGLSILAGMAWERLSRAKDQCGKAAEEGREALRPRLPSLGDNPAESSTYSRPD